MLGRQPKDAESHQKSQPSALTSQTKPDVMKQYTHVSLDYDTHVQLALVSPSADSCATLQVTLHTFTWEKVPDFAYIINSMAFSYEAVSDISLCDELYIIPRSLDVFLRKVRQPEK